MDGENPVGMFTERDYARNVFLKGKSSPGTPVRDVMAKPVIIVPPKHMVDECMSLMTRKRVRHLPVLDAGVMVGMLSIGDRVKSVIDERQHTIEQLEHYIRARRPGLIDVVPPEGEGFSLYAGFARGP